jgi:7-keto-8-aminopelargonate synthetase-like enzyme
MGRGVAEHYGLPSRSTSSWHSQQVSASIGGFVWRSQIIDTLRHTARSHIFSASLPPAAVAAPWEAITIVDQELSDARACSPTPVSWLTACGSCAQASYRQRHRPLLCGNELLARRLPQAA